MSKQAREQPASPGNPIPQPDRLALPPARRYRRIIFSVLLLFILAVFSFLTLLVETTPSFAIDLQITRAIQSIDSPYFAGFMTLISWPGFLPQSMIITLLIAILLYVSGLRWEAVTSLLAASFSGVSNELIKGLVQRPRPSADLVEVVKKLSSYSFPSGHVMFYTILFGFTWYVIYTLIKPSWIRSLLLVILALFIVFVGASRIYLGQHWASDVLGAYLLGSLILAVTIQLYRWGKTRFFVHPPDPTQ